MVSPPEPPLDDATSGEPPPRPAVWSLWLGGLVSAGLLAAIGLQLARTPPTTFAVLAGLSPAAFVSFTLLYLAQPLADLAIYRRVWSLPVSALGALLRKTALNEAVLGYSGELYLYVWARRRAGLAYAPFAAIRDVNILSSIMGFGVTLAVLALAMTGADNPDLVRLLRPVQWPAVGVMAAALVVLVVARRVFSLRPSDIVFVTAVHAARLLAYCGLTIATWALALPTVALDVWVVLLAVTLLGARIPFLTNKALVVGNVVLLLLGPGSSFAVLLAAMAVATLCTHVAVIGVLGAYDLWRVLRGSDLARPTR
jgi:hypothetical protein